jgi:hypothetical protein
VALGLAMTGRARVYVAGPYTKGDVGANVRAAMAAGSALIRAGYAPFIPHLFHFLHIAEPQPYDVWMELDAEWIRMCHALVRLPGESSGADAEVAEARRLGVLVFDSVEALLDFAAGRSSGLAYPHSQGER